MYTYIYRGQKITRLIYFQTKSFFNDCVKIIYTELYFSIPLIKRYSMNVLNNLKSYCNGMLLHYVLILNK